MHDPSWIAAASRGAAVLWDTDSTASCFAAAGDKDTTASWEAAAAAAASWNMTASCGAAASWGDAASWDTVAAALWNSDSAAL